MGVAVPSRGQVVRVRSRQYLVEDIEPPRQKHDHTLVRLSCLDDDAQGVPLEVLWESEVDALILDGDAWKAIGKKGFDPPRLFSAYLNTLKWNCVTATDPRLFQAPYRAGIDIKAYQLEPLRKALKLPRVNLFIADDVGLGKTIEAGLIVRELLLRQKVRRIVIAAPPSVVQQWRDEMEARFGLTFVIYGRDYVLEKRRERGYGVNPWKAHSRFIISHALVRDESYASLLRDWLDEPGVRSGSLLILDEAHNAAPASGARYAIDSQLTKAVRDLAPRFEHRLFLSATPHNGHSNSFAALLELLDPQRFIRGVPVRGPKVLDDVMVRRLKSDLREVLHEGFPRRVPDQIDIDGLPADAPERLLPRLLSEYAALRAERLQSTRKSVQNAAALITTSLQKRLLSSIEAFARTLKVHRDTLERQARKAAEPPRDLSLLSAAPDADDDRAELSEDDVAAEEAAQMEAATEATEGHAEPRPSTEEQLKRREKALLDRMTEVAEAARGQADPRVRKLVAWIREHLCPGTPPKWNRRRVLIFTEYTDTKRYLEQQFRQAFPDARERVASFHGGMADDIREELKRAFNADPDRHPLRILIATDAAREGVNLQNHCADLFHFDVPWNPSRMEQRNGRIDRVLQRAPEVYCRYFFFAQRPEDKVLQALVRKTDLVQRELGSLSRVLEQRLERLLGQGIRDADEQARQIDDEDATPGVRQAVDDELEVSRERREELSKQIEGLRSSLARSHKAIGFEETAFRDAISCALELLRAEPLKAETDAHGKPRWVFPALDAREGADPTWADTLDTLRPVRSKEQPPWEWRKAAPRPVVFADPGSLDADVVHLHLEHRVVQRLLGRFRAQGFIHDDLSRACVGQTRDPIPRVVVLGRLALYGEGATRLHDEVIAVAARWVEPDARRGALKPFGAEGETNALRLLEDALAHAREAGLAAPVQEKLLHNAAQDMADLIPHLEARGRELAESARADLDKRGEAEAADMVKILERQREWIQAQARKVEKEAQLTLDFDEDEKRQLDADKREWHNRLLQIPEELRTEPERIRRAYSVKATRIEPVGLVYLWPVTG